jgi:hypothetical protein
MESVSIGASWARLREIGEALIATCDKDETYDVVQYTVYAMDNNSAALRGSKVILTFYNEDMEDRTTPVDRRGGGCTGGIAARAGGVGDGGACCR